MNIFSFFKKEVDDSKTSSYKPATPKHIMIPVKMQDGTIQDYPEDFIITDGVNCVVSQGKYYHTSLDCENLKWELANCNPMRTGMNVKDAKKQGMIHCANCSTELYHFKKGDLQK